MSVENGVAKCGNVVILSMGDQNYRGVCKREKHTDDHHTDGVFAWTHEEYS